MCVVSVVVVIPYNGVWQVSNAPFRMLAQEAAQLLNEEGDREVLGRGQALSGLFLDRLNSAQRIAVVS